jgi:hypothetical protein
VDEYAKMREEPGLQREIDRLKMSCHRRGGGGDLVRSAAFRLDPRFEGLDRQAHPRS